MKERLIRLLTENFPDKDFLSSDTLVDDGIFDSLTIVSLISLIYDELGIDVPFELISKENFNSVGSISDLLSSLE